MQTVQNELPPFSRGKMTNKDFDSILIYVNAHLREQAERKKDSYAPFLSVDPILFKEKTHRKNKTIHERIIFNNEPVIIALFCDPGMTNVATAHMKTVEHAKSKGYVQKLFGKFNRKIEEASEFVYIGDIIIGAHPVSIPVPIQQHETEPTRKEFA